MWRQPGARATVTSDKILAVCQHARELVTSDDILSVCQVARLQLHTSPVLAIPGQGAGGSARAPGRCRGRCHWCPSVTLLTTTKIARETLRLEWRRLAIGRGVKHGDKGPQAWSNSVSDKGLDDRGSYSLWLESTRRMEIKSPVAWKWSWGIALVVTSRHIGWPMVHTQCPGVWRGC